MHIQQIVKVLSTIIVKVNFTKTKLYFTRVYRSKEVTDIEKKRAEVINFCFYSEENVERFLEKEDISYSQQLFVLDAKHKDKLKSLSKFNLIFVSNLYKSYAFIAEEIAKNPWDKLTSFTVTGTNGKTSTSWFIYQFLSLLGEESALVNGEGFYLNKKKVSKHSLTTPDVAVLQEYAQQALDEKYSSIILESSSHAISQCRLATTKFDYLVFTNLSQDHLDYHKTMENYFDVKKELFLNHSKKNAVNIINIDCKYGKSLANFLQLLDKNIISYGVDQSADCVVQYSRSQENYLNIKLFVLGESFSFKTRMFSQSFASNLVASILVLYAHGYSFKELRRVCGRIELPVGRQEVFSTKKGRIIVDYAHTPEAMESLLNSFKEFVNGNMIVVFGCGGNRDKEKRSQMGEIARKNADYVILTDDNPRDEVPEDIIKDIESGGELIIRDRGQAIEKAISLLNSPDDFVFILGKGAEEQQVYAEKIIRFSDREFIQQFLESCSLKIL